MPPVSGRRMPRRNEKGDMPMSRKLNGLDKSIGGMKQLLLVQDPLGQRQMYLRASPARDGDQHRRGHEEDSVRGKDLVWKGNSPFEKVK